MMGLKMFAYGMNTNNSGMSYRCPTATNLGKATLIGFRLRFAYHADVIPDPSSSVDGVLWDISRDDLATLDMVEGYPQYYSRRIAKAQHDGIPVNVLVYFMNPGVPDEFPDKGYLKTIVQGYRSSGVPLSQLQTALDRVKQEKWDGYRRQK